MSARRAPGEIIAEFEQRYPKEYDFYDRAARLTAQTLDQALQQAGIRAIVTSRAKSPGRAVAKAAQRAATKKYLSVDDIYRDLVDLAGVRLALYFPGERDQVDKIIKQKLLLEEEPRQFPLSSAEPSYKKRFSGYWATHYRVKLPESLLNESERRYQSAVIEIQVASILMHAWSEVEHDLVYKPLQGRLSEDEYAILDELNGLVLSGEIALERLQKAGERRVATAGRAFENHYDLATYLLDRARPLIRENEPETVIGNVNILFELLKTVDLNAPDKLNPYIEALSDDFERRPLSEQIIDQILIEDPERYRLYDELRSREDRQGTSLDNAVELKIGKFLAVWIELERLLETLAPSRRIGTSSRIIYRVNPARYLNWNDEEASEFERLRRFRNYLVHGVERPSPQDIDDAIEKVRALIERIKKAQDDPR